MPLGGSVEAEHLVPLVDETDRDAGKCTNHSRPHTNHWRTRTDQNQALHVRAMFPKYGLPGLPRARFVSGHFS